MDKDIIHKELDLIQDIVKRMADNSFKIKAWLIGLLFAIVAFEKDAIFIEANDNIPAAVTYGLNALLLLPILCFWYLDGFFLHTERLYRNLYKWVVANRPDNKNYLYDLNTFKREDVRKDGAITNLADEGVMSVIFSKTLIPFYIIPLLFVIGLFAYNLSI